SANTLRAALSSAARFSALFCSRRPDRSLLARAVAVPAWSVIAARPNSSPEPRQLVPQPGHHIIHRPRRRLQRAAHADEAMDQRVELAMHDLHPGRRELLGIG